MSPTRGVAVLLTIALLGISPIASGQDDFKVTLLDATIRDRTIPGAEIILQRAGETSVKASSGADGKAVFPRPFGGKDDESITLIVKKTGYSPLVVKCPCNELTYALSPVIRSLDGLRVVLNWGAEPKDLDSHMVYEDQHVYFSKKSGTDTNLDVDELSGFGPETITVAKKHSGTRYVYAVHNYSDKDKKGSTSLARKSQAKVFVYVGSSLVRTFLAPPGGTGNLWVVFGIGENGEFYDINQFHDLNDREGASSSLASIINGGPLVSAPVMAADGKSRADALNRQGEQAYHAKQLDDAVRFYLEAINLNPEHSQAYSNLGLAYQKLGNRAEAIWANRKAIALATGSNANTVKASSYYNIARVYEEQEQWQEALQAFKSAQALKTHDAYKKGIERMNAKLGK